MCHVVGFLEETQCIKPLNSSIPTSDVTVHHDRLIDRAVECHCLLYLMRCADSVILCCMLLICLMQRDSVAMLFQSIDRCVRRDFEVYRFLRQLIGATCHHKISCSQTIRKPCVHRSKDNPSISTAHAVFINSLLCFLLFSIFFSVLTFEIYAIRRVKPRIIDQSLTFSTTALFCRFSFLRCSARSRRSLNSYANDNTSSSSIVHSQPSLSNEHHVPRAILSSPVETSSSTAAPSGSDPTTLMDPSTSSSMLEHPVSSNTSWRSAPTDTYTIDKWST